jgi:hypothetical protein
MMVALALRVIMRLIVGAQYKFHTLTHNCIIMYTCSYLIKYATVNHVQYEVYDVY